MKRFQLTVLAAAIGLMGAAHAQVQNSTTNYLIMFQFQDALESGASNMAAC